MPQPAPGRLDGGAGAGAGAASLASSLDSSAPPPEPLDSSAPPPEPFLRAMGFFLGQSGRSQSDESLDSVDDSPKGRFFL